MTGGIVGRIFNKKNIEMKIAKNKEIISVKLCYSALANHSVCRNNQFKISKYNMGNIFVVSIYDGKKIVEENKFISVDTSLDLTGQLMSFCGSCENSIENYNKKQTLIKEAKYIIEWDVLTASQLATNECLFTGKIKERKIIKGKTKPIVGEIAVSKSGQIGLVFKNQMHYFDDNVDTYVEKGDSLQQMLDGVYEWFVVEFLQEEIVV